MHYVTIFQRSLGRSHKTGLTVALVHWFVSKNKRNLQMYLFTKKVLEIEPTKWYKTQKTEKRDYYSF
jgi:hypothetical protein